MQRPYNVVAYELASAEEPELKTWTTDLANSLAAVWWNSGFRMPTKVQITTLTVRHSEPNTTVLRIRDILDRILALWAAGMILSTQQQAHLCLWVEDGALASAAPLAYCAALIRSLNETLGDIVA
jgi:hypothetical protein